MSSTTSPTNTPAPTRPSITIPEPIERHPKYTHNTHSHAKSPSSFPSLYTLPIYTAHPAYYAAAIDTIHYTNNYFDGVGNGYGYANDMTAPCVLEELAYWRSGRPDEAKYPTPPDLRTLYVKYLKGSARLLVPGDDTSVVGRVWDKACEEFAAMTELEKSGWLRMTKAFRVAENARRDPPYPGDGVVFDHMWLRIFKRWLVWKKHVQALEVGEIEEEEPSAADLASFFGSASVKEKGASLADRIERLATLTPRTAEDGGIKESVYVPRDHPIEDEVEDEEEDQQHVAPASSKRRRPSSSPSSEDSAPPAKRVKKRCTGRTRAHKACKNRKLLDPSAGPYNCGRH